MKHLRSAGLGLLGLAGLLPGAAMAAEIDGAALSVLWGVPCAGVRPKRCDAIPEKIMEALFKPKVLREQSKGCRH